jgi:hypothetical protein
LVPLLKSFNEAEFHGEEYVTKENLSSHGPGSKESKEGGDRVPMPLLRAYLVTQPPFTMSLS